MSIGNGHHSTSPAANQFAAFLKAEDSVPTGSPPPAAQAGLPDGILRRLINNAVMTRRQLVGELQDRRRSLESECGYPEVEPDAAQYQELYEYHPIAARVVEAMPRECWQVHPVIYEKEEGDESTEFEAAFDELPKMLRGEQSWYRAQETNPLQDIFLRADVRSGIGQYGVVLIGIDDGLDLSVPARGVVEQNSVPSKTKPKGKGDEPETTPNRPATKASSLEDQGIVAAQSPDPLTHPDPPAPLAVNADGEAMPLYSLSVNAEQVAGRKVKYVRVFTEAQATVAEWETNWTGERFGQPVMYQIVINAPGMQTSGAASAPAVTKLVHWTRCVHIGRGETLSAPRMRQVLRRLLDLAKIYGASGEAYWKSCFAGLAFETHPALGGDVEIDEAKLRNMVEEYWGGLQRALILMGMSAKPLAPSVVDPTPHINAHLEAICIKLAMPVRIFKGSERGELASSQDDMAWNDRVKEEQNNHCTNHIIVPVVDRLIMLGVLPRPKSGEYFVWWPDITSQSETERLANLNSRVGAYATYVKENLQTIIPPLDFMTRWDNLSEEEAQAIIEAAEEHAAKLEEEAAAKEEEALARQAELAASLTIPGGGQQGDPAEGVGELPTGDDEEVAEVVDEDEADLIGVAAGDDDEDEDN